MVFFSERQFVFKPFSHLCECFLLCFGLAHHKDSLLCIYKLSGAFLYVKTVCICENVLVSR